MCMCVHCCVRVCVYVHMCVSVEGGRVEGWGCLQHGDGVGEGVEAELGGGRSVVVAPVHDPAQQRGAAMIVVQQQLDGLPTQRLHL